MIRVESKIEGRKSLVGWHDGTVAVDKKSESEWVKTNGGLNSVRSSRGDKTSRAKEEVEKQVTKRLRVFIFLNFWE